MKYFMAVLITIACLCFLQTSGVSGAGDSTSGTARDSPTPDREQLKPFDPLKLPKIRYTKEGTKNDNAVYIRLHRVPDQKTGDVQPACYSIRFSDTAAPLPERTAIEDPDGNSFVELKKIEVPEKLDDKRYGQREQKAEILYGLKLTDFSEILFGCSIKFEKTANDQTRTLEDGWRLRFKTNF